METKSDSKLADGIRFERPKEGTPSFVKGGVGVEVDKFIEFLKANKNDKGWVKLDLLESKEKKSLYFKLNDWKPTIPGEQKNYPQPGVGDVPNPDDIPF